MNCCYCERPLLCDSCGKPFEPHSQADFMSLHQAELPVICRACDRVLQCRWCGAIYSGAEDEYANDSARAS